MVNRARLLRKEAKSKLTITPEMVDLLRKIQNEGKITTRAIMKLPYASNTIKALERKALVARNKDYDFELTERGRNLLNLEPRFSGNEVDQWGRKHQSWNVIDYDTYFSNFSEERQREDIKKELPSEGHTTVFAKKFVPDPEWPKKEKFEKRYAELMKLDKKELVAKVNQSSRLDMSHMKSEGKQDIVNYICGQEGLLKPTSKKRAGDFGYPTLDAVIAKYPDKYIHVFIGTEDYNTASVCDTDLSHTQIYSTPVVPQGDDQEKANTHNKQIHQGGKMSHRASLLQKRSSDRTEWPFIGTPDPEWPKKEKFEKRWAELKTMSSQELYEIAKSVSKHPNLVPRQESKKERMVFICDQEGLWKPNNNYRIGSKSKRAETAEWYSARAEFDPMDIAISIELTRGGTGQRTYANLTREEATDLVRSIQNALEEMSDYENQNL